MFVGRIEEVIDSYQWFQILPTMFNWDGVPQTEYFIIIVQFIYNVYKLENEMGLKSSSDFKMNYFRS